MPVAFRDIGHGDVMVHRIPSLFPLCLNLQSGPKMAGWQLLARRSDLPDATSMHTEA